MLANNINPNQSVDAQADLALLQSYRKVIFYLEVLFDTSLNEIIYTNLGIKKVIKLIIVCFVCVEVLGPSQPSGVMLSGVSLPNHTFTGQA